MVLLNPRLEVAYFLYQPLMVFFFDPDLGYGFLACGDILCVSVASVILDDLEDQLLVVGHILNMF